MTRSRIHQFSYVRLDGAVLFTKTAVNVTSQSWNMQSLHKEFPENTPPASLNITKATESRFKVLCSEICTPIPYQSVPSNSQRINIRLNELICILPEIIVQLAVTIRPKLHQLPALTPLRPVRQLDAHIRIQVVDEVVVVSSYRSRSVIRKDAVKYLQQVGAMERAQNGCPVVVRREVGP